MNTADKSFKRYTITAALPYANGPLHLGHLAGAYLPADFYVRYLKARGKDVLFVCGTDEHGAAIDIRAYKEGVSPQALVDKYYEVIKKGFEDLNVDFDVFSRTSKEIHHETAKEFFLKFYEEGKLLEQRSEQLYDPEAGRFLADRFVTGTCPKCGHDSAYGDQCENCGSALNATELINPKSTISGAEPVMKATKHWYFPLDQYQDQLNKFILEDHQYWKPNVYGQCKSWLNEGLQPRAITRDLEWGVKVPVEDAEGKVLYVWFDAPIGYISATREWAEQQKAKGLEADWKTWWQKDEDTALIHFIGKDNIVFHCIIFPAMLMGHGEFVLPENVPANEFLNLEGGKLSTSRNWAVWVHEFFEDFPGQGDVLRYALATTLPENKDNDFTWKTFQSRNNDELADILGNFIRRVVVLSDKYYDGLLPECQLTESQLEVLAEAKKLLEETGRSIENFRFREAASTAMNIARLGNRFFAETEPWHLIKSDPDAVKPVILTATNIAAYAAVASAPFMPGSSVKIFENLGMEPVSWDDALASHPVSAGHQLGKATILFQKIEDAVIDAQLEKLKNAAQQKEEAEHDFLPQKDTVAFDDFQKMDLRVGKVLEAERVPKTDKLLKLTVDIGFEKRTIVSGVAHFFEPEKLIGKKVTVLANLAPRKIRGVESQGMLLFAEDTEGILRLVSPVTEAPEGSTIN